MATREGKQSPEELQETRKESARLKQEVTRAPIRKAIIELGLKIVVGYPQKRRPDMMSGLIEGAIIGSTVSFPVANSDKPRVEYEKAPGGRWVGYDFNRPSEFPTINAKHGVKQLTRGRLVAFLLDRVMDNEPEERTPTASVDFTSLDDVFSFDTPTIDELVDAGMLRLTTQGEAYERVGLYDVYGEELSSRSVEDDPVFQVTPKGNSLVSLERDFGEKKPRESEMPNLGWVPNNLAPRRIAG